MGYQTYALTGNQKAVFERSDKLKGIVAKKSSPTESASIPLDLERTHYLGSSNDVSTIKEAWKNSEDSDYLQGNISGSSTLPEFLFDNVHFNMSQEIYPEKIKKRKVVCKFGYLENKTPAGFTLIFDSAKPGDWIISVMKNANAPSFEERKLFAYWSDSAKTDFTEPYSIINNIQDELKDVFSFSPAFAFMQHIILPTGEVNTEITDELAKLKPNSSNTEILETLKNKIASTDHLLKKFNENINALKLLYPQKEEFLKELEEKISTIHENIKRIEEKSKKLKDRYPDDEVGAVLESLAIQSRQALNTVLSNDNPSNPELLKNFEQKSEQYTKNALDKKDENGDPILDKHRGAAKVVYNLALAIAGVGLFYGIAVGIHLLATKGKHGFFEPPIHTNSEKQVEELAKSAQSLKPPKNG